MKYSIVKWSVYLVVITMAFLHFSCTKTIPSDNNSAGNPPLSKPFYEYIANLDKPVLVDFGASSCTPCKLMEPILKDLQTSYSDQFETIFVHVNKEPDKMKEFQITVIPTQIFFSAEGEELFRHVGFFSKEDILKTFQENGVPVQIK